MFANSAATARIPSGFEFIRNKESRNAGKKPVHGFMVSLSKPGCGCLVPAGKATALPRHPAGAAQAFMDCGDMSPLSKRRHVGALQRRTSASG